MLEDLLFPEKNYCCCLSLRARNLAQESCYTRELGYCRLQQEWNTECQQRLCVMSYRPAHIVTQTKVRLVTISGFVPAGYCDSPWHTSACHWLQSMNHIFVATGLPCRKLPPLAYCLKIEKLAILCLCEHKLQMWRLSPSRMLGMRQL